MFHGGNGSRGRRNAGTCGRLGSGSSLVSRLDSSENQVMSTISRFPVVPVSSKAGPSWPRPRSA
jgi:hypothetical protein